MRFKETLPVTANVRASEVKERKLKCVTGHEKIGTRAKRRLHAIDYREYTGVFERVFRWPGCNSRDMGELGV